MKTTAAAQWQRKNKTLITAMAKRMGVTPQTIRNVLEGAHQNPAVRAELIKTGAPMPPAKKFRVTASMTSAMIKDAKRNWALYHRGTCRDIALACLVPPMLVNRVLYERSRAPRQAVQKQIRKKLEAAGAPFLPATPGGARGAG